MKQSFRFIANTDIGQNFLVDKSVVEFMLKKAALKERDRVLEIGPGRGILTRSLLESPCEAVYAVEIDTRLKPELERLVACHPNLTLIWGDAVRLDYDSLLPQHPTHLIANLPYHITTPLLWTLLEKMAEKELRYIQVMLQHEVAIRFTQEAQKKERCPLGLTLQAMGKTTLLRKVSRTAFRPAPQVESAILEVIIEQNRQLPKDKPWRRLLAVSFAQRRKTLVNNWMNGYSLSREHCVSILETLGLSSFARPEELELDQWISLSQLDIFRQETTC